ncbi:MAG: 4Fe-4S dicluster domain-containing protein [Candidatus Aminicenantes bacterium]|nr:4Fe-4S dicluster domain-containing protein [Candidatus Aminicenantes bacterium]
MKAQNSTLWHEVRGSLFWPALFAGIGVWQLLATGNWFYLVNFGYIGLAIGIGDLLTRILPPKKKARGRKVTQLMVGLYMLGFLGFLGRENMQIEGFFFYLLAGVFAGATLHYFIAKIVGPLIFGRAWCGWACWTAMVLDFLPWTKPRAGRIRYLGVIRYAHLALSLLLVLFVSFILKNPLERRDEFVWLIVGNLVYYSSSILLAGVLKDNRAFCKYGCPIPPLQKLGARFSLMRIQADRGLCNECAACEKMCPMNIRLLEYIRRGKRILSTECILCQTCVRICPSQALKTTFKIDAGFREYIHFGEPVGEREAGCVRR